MIIMILLELLIWGSVVGLILVTARKMWRKASVKRKIDHLKLVDENYKEVVKAQEQFKDTEKKEDEIKKFTN